MIFLDTETCGFTGPCVLIQYAQGETGHVHIHDIWYHSVRNTLGLIEKIVENPGGVCAYNLTFDWFHLVKLYNLFRLVQDKSRIPNVSEIADLHHHPDRAAWCLKPQSSLDLMLHLRKSPMQSLMSRKNVVIRKVPVKLASKLAGYLRREMVYDDIYFAKRPAGYEWTIDYTDDDDADFRDLTLRFAPSGGLKAVCQHLFGVRTYDLPIIIPFSEDDYNPYATNWTTVIFSYMQRWRSNKKARGYAEDDVILLQRLHQHFCKPPTGDDDSELAVSAANVRWKGYAIDIPAMKRERDACERILADCPVNTDRHQQVKQWLKDSLDDELEKLMVTDTSSDTLERLANEFTERDRAEETDVGKMDKQVAGRHNSEIQKRIKQIQQTRRASKKLGILSKLLETGRFCPAFQIIGAKSGRMSGGSFESSTGGRLNPQGIQRETAFRRLFTFADPETQLDGGDFVSFEITILEAWCHDPTLRADLQSGKSFHAAFGALLYNKTYEEILASKGLQENYYGRAKNCTFGVFYGARPNKIASTANINQEEAERGINELYERHPMWAQVRSDSSQSFAALSQLGGQGTPVRYRVPPEYCESLLGFRRYFVLENYTVRRLFELASQLPDEFRIVGTVTRRKASGRSQSPFGAIQSAIYAAAFNLQSYNIRAVLNHYIQSPGATITKGVQRVIWDVQPVGIHEVKVQPSNYHDEIMVVCDSMETSNRVKQVMEEKVKEYQKRIPFLKMDWKQGFSNWSEK